MHTIDSGRIEVLRTGTPGPGPVVCWLTRDFRISDNWALLQAQEMALIHELPLIVLITPEQSTTRRRWAFLLQGLQELEQSLNQKNIRLVVSLGGAAVRIQKILASLSAGAVVVDFSPMKPIREVVAELVGSLNVPCMRVDSHNIVPWKEASDKTEYAAYTIRPKINRQLSRYLTSIPEIVRHPYPNELETRAVNWDTVEKSITIDEQVGEVVVFEGGESAAGRAMMSFVTARLARYGEHRNDPNANAQSDLSPYLNFGFLAPQQVALEVSCHAEDIASQEAFLEELIIRRELSDNFCFYNNNYDSFEGFHAWAQKTLNEHRADPRPYVYSGEQFEKAQTHDELWNAAQRQMVIDGKMHGYMRMYWAKKILEWSVSPEEAFATALYLNDTYSLDGCDPNGVCGVAWSIGGVHDRAWFEREVFGKIRFMSEGGCRRKFDVAAYVANVPQFGEQVTS